MVQTFNINGREVKVTAKNKRVAKKWGGAHYAYTITIEVDDKLFKTTFHDSVMNYMRRQGMTKETLYTALDCIFMDYDSYDYNPNLGDFMDEYGYDPEEDEGEKVFNACKQTYNALNAMFSREDLNAFTEAVDILLGGK